MAKGQKLDPHETVTEALNVLAAVDEMFKAIPKKKQGEYLGHLNEVCLFVEGVKRAAEIEVEARAQAKAKAEAEAPVGPAGAIPRVGDPAQCAHND